MINKMQVQEIPMHQHQMQVENSTYVCLSVRMSNLYIIMVAVQLILSASILGFQFFSVSEMVMAGIQISVAFLLSLDLLIRYFSELQNFWRSKCNWIDVFILILISTSIWIDISQPILPNQKYHENDEIGAAIIICRYLVQFCRICILVKTSKELREQRMYTGMISLTDSQTITH